MCRPDDCPVEVAQLIQDCVNPQAARRPFVDEVVACLSAACVDSTPALQSIESCEPWRIPPATLEIVPKRTASGQEWGEAASRDMRHLMRATSDGKGFGVAPVLVRKASNAMALL